MKIHRTNLEEGIAGLTISGEFDAFAVNPFLEQIDSIISSGNVNIVVNQRLVLFINSTAVGSLIKARKRLRGLSGELVISEPSERVKSTLQTLGLSQVLRCFPSDEAACDHLKATASEQVDIPSENAVLVRFKDAAKAREYARIPDVPRMVSLEEHGIRFVAKGTTDLYSSGSEVKVKFRLPLFRRAYYYEIPASIREAQSEGNDGVRVFAQFDEIHEEDRRSISQFLRDMRLLREEARSGDQG